MGSDPGSYEARATSQRSPLLRRWIAIDMPDKVSGDDDLSMQIPRLRQPSPQPPRPTR